MSAQDDSLIEYNARKMSQAEGKPPEDGREQTTKRRTKTGCLTCRRRRIKCGEERPICKNCIKSKRDCTGYSQPTFPGHHGHTTPDIASGAVPDMDPRLDAGGRTSQSYRSSYGETQQLQYNHGIPHSAREDTMWSTQPVFMFPVTPSTFSHQQHSSLGIPGSVSMSGVPVSYDHYTGSQQYTSPPDPLHMANHQADSKWLSTYSTTLSPSISQTSFRLPSTQYNDLGFAQHSALAKQTSVVGFTAESANSMDDLEDPEDPWDVEVMDPYTQSDDNYRPSSPVPYREWHQGERGHPYAVISKNFLTVSSPLLEEKSQKIFRHFIAVTGPCMGTFERHELLHSNSPKMLWTHELPTMAFQHAALAHAILAVSAMHMSKLGLCNDSVALKHFTYACRRVGKSLGSSHARLEISTLATVLLLGYYEVMGGDHSRWSLHLGGAARLVMEHDYATITRSVKHARTQINADKAQVSAWKEAGLEAENLAANNLSQLLNDDIWKVSKQLVSKLMGSTVDYDAQIQPNFEKNIIIPHLNQDSIQGWMTLMELYWWYCKQDIFQSMLSGEPLLLPYSKWKYCPPRGPINNIDKAHATMDHLWLLLARLTEFSGKDRKRKQQVVEAQGGQWVPAPGFLEPRLGRPSGVNSAKPSANEGRARTSRQPAQQPPPQQPMFYGMMPPSANEIQISPSFEAMNAQLKFETSPPLERNQDPSDVNLEQRTRDALIEHSSISEAFDHFESCLGADFRPLASNDIQITTPFGAAIRYRSPAIAAMWSFFLVGRIVLRRAHPYSPPAAMMSAGVNAAFTKKNAQLVGRICGGLFAQHSYLLQAGHVDHLLSAAVMEVTFPLLFAAVQFQDPIQRGWTIGKLSEIAQGTGWQSSAAVAAACETTWETMGLSGKGPPYERTLDQENADARVNGKYRYLYGLSSKIVTPAGQNKDIDSRFVSHDRSLIDRQANTRVHWAMGLMSLEEDLRRMALNDNN